jgi:hypothetical protein
MRQQTRAVLSPKVDFQVRASKVGLVIAMRCVEVEVITFGLCYFRGVMATQAIDLFSLLFLRNLERAVTTTFQDPTPTCGPLNPNSRVKMSGPRGLYPSHAGE